jgi:type I site-specific restriction endonuclease
MATGTGKTRTCIAMVDALMRAGWAFPEYYSLVDRIALRDQALEAFKEHLHQRTIRFGHKQGETRNCHRQTSVCFNLSNHVEHHSQGRKKFDLRISLT